MDLNEAKKMCLSNIPLFSLEFTYCVTSVKSCHVSQLRNNTCSFSSREFYAHQINVKKEREMFYLVLQS
jgi:hypothetical protein